MAHLADTDVAVLASVATRGVPAAGLLTMFGNMGFIPVDPSREKQSTAVDLSPVLRPADCLRSHRAWKASYGHAVVVFGIDADVDDDIVLLKDPNTTVAQLGSTDDLSDATAVTLDGFNVVLAHRSLAGTASSASATVTRPQFQSWQRQPT